MILLHVCYTAFANPMKILSALIKAKSSLSWKDNRGRTPLHLTVNANSGSADTSSEIEELLIELGADLYAMDVRGRVPLHYVFVKIGA